MKRLILTMIAGCAGVMAAMAIPTKSGPIKYTQPDGTVITVTVKGDEFGHLIFSEEGLLLKESKGRLEYAKFDADGIPCASGIAAGSKLSEVEVLRLQTPSQISSWAARIENNKREVLEKRYALHASPKFHLSKTENDNGDLGNDNLIPQNYGKFHNLFPVAGDQNVLVLLVEYKDRQFEYASFDYFERFLNEDGFSDYGSLGSVRDWLLENSLGKYNPHFDVYGPIKLPKNSTYYGVDSFFGMDERSYQMAVDAMKIIDEEVDFSIYDGNGDGLIDNVFIIYAGAGDFGEDTIWPHEAFVSEFTNSKYSFDGVQLEQYACACEHMYDTTRPDGIGTFVHEFCHVMGLPDIYAKGLGIFDGFTPGEWSVIDRGPYNNDGLTPPNFSSFERAALGWLDVLTMEEGAIEIPNLAESNVAYVLPTDNKDEFFFFENRQQVGNDTFLPGHGMLVWHIDYKENDWQAGEVNNDGSHQNVDIIEADNIKTDATRSGDSFPGTSGVTEFGINTEPKLESWSGMVLPFDITDIFETEEGIIRFNAIHSTIDPGSVENATAESSRSIKPIFDVFGRRILKAAPGQVYIQDGKKRIGQ